MMPYAPVGSRPVDIRLGYGDPELQVGVVNLPGGNNRELQIAAADRRVITAIDGYFQRRIDPDFTGDQLVPGVRKIFPI